MQVRREKAIYHTLNKLSMDTSRKVLVAEAWCPLAAKPRVHEALRQAAQASSTQVLAGSACFVGAQAPRRGLHIVCFARFHIFWAPVTNGWLCLLVMQQ